ncbi:hydrogenase maturation protease [Candidatus Bipolaricaulota bacterium]|nr:hydrogenase maturation protease [Candidatus Bipolaricaulota bacterium]
MAVVALGNPYRTDDGVGPAVLRLLEETRHASRVTRHEVDLLESAHGGLPLAQALVGYARALIVDAAPFLPPGELSLLPLHPHPNPSRGREGCSPALGGRGLGGGGTMELHSLGLAEALAALAQAGFPVPECWALAIGIPGDPPFGEGLSPQVAAAVPRAVEEVKRWLTE